MKGALVSVVHLPSRSSASNAAPLGTLHPPGCHRETLVRRRTDLSTNTRDYTEAAWLSGKGTGFRARLPGFESQPVTCVSGLPEPATSREQGLMNICHTSMMASVAEPGGAHGIHSVILCSHHGPCSVHLRQYCPSNNSCCQNVTPPSLGLGMCVATAPINSRRQGFCSLSKSERLRLGRVGVEN